MKTLKESILSRSSHGGEGFRAQRREMIESWLKEYNIKGYTINDDYTIDVDGDVNLVRKNLTEFPDYIQFGVVKGYFDCSNNNLTSLGGAPEEVGGDFYCTGNNLKDLKGAPKKVKGIFGCSYNNLIDLKGAPKDVGRDFFCSNNQLTSLEGVPEEVVGDFVCSYNKIQFTEEDVRKVCNVDGSIIY